MCALDSEWRSYSSRQSLSASSRANAQRKNGKRAHYKTQRYPRVQAWPKKRKASEHKERVSVVTQKVDVRGKRRKMCVGTRAYPAKTHALGTAVKCRCA